MPRYLVRKDTFVSHLGKIVRAGELLDTEWPKLPKTGKKAGESAEPKKIDDNLELVSESVAAEAPASGT